MEMNQDNGGQTSRGGPMTEDQMEELRRQICVYSVLSQQLIDMYYATVYQHDAAGTKSPSLSFIFFIIFPVISIYSTMQTNHIVRTMQTTSACIITFI